jgi:predicted metal-dependent HD superfamily phosphohydrolase
MLIALLRAYTSLQDERRDRMQAATAQFAALWSRLKASGNAQQILGKLTALYTQPHRAYHNLDHILNMQRELERGRVLCAHPDEVEFAIWLHDAIYDPKAKDNEEQSAELAVEILNGAQVGADIGQRVRALILATKHAAAPSDPDACVLVDADLSILGKPAAEFDAYETAIRKEYAWVPDDQFRTGRSAILRHFLARPRIFSTAPFFEAYEQPARANLARSIKALSAPGGSTMALAQ